MWAVVDAPAAVNCILVKRKTSVLLLWLLYFNGHVYWADKRHHLAFDSHASWQSAEREREKEQHSRHVYHLDPPQSRRGSSVPDQVVAECGLHYTIRGKVLHNSKRNKTAICAQSSCYKKTQEFSWSLSHCTKSRGRLKTGWKISWHYLWLGVTHSPPRAATVINRTATHQERRGEKIFFLFSHFNNIILKKNKH